MGKVSTLGKKSFGMNGYDDHIVSAFILLKDT